MGKWVWTVAGLGMLAFLVGAAPTTMPAETAPDWVVKQRGSVLGWEEDGRGMYMLVKGPPRVNVWAVGVYYWPEAVGAVVALLLARWTLRRFRRRQQSPDECYCRGCDYLLRGLTAERCPECGLTLTPRNRLNGRRGAWKVGVALLVLWGMAFYAGRSLLPREGRVGSWLNWRSQRLAGWGMARGYTWLNRHSDEFHVVIVDPQGERATRWVSPDPGTGNVRRLLPDKSAGVGSPNGIRVVLPRPTSSVLELYDGSSGDKVGEISIGPPNPQFYLGAIQGDRVLVFTNGRAEVIDLKLRRSIATIQWPWDPQRQLVDTGAAMLFDHGRKVVQDKWVPPEFRIFDVERLRKEQGK